MHIFFARNWQMPFLHQRKGENDRRKYFMINLHERMLPTWSPVRRCIQLSHRGQFYWKSSWAVMKFATLITPSSVYMSRIPFSKIPSWAQWSQRKWNIIYTICTKRCCWYKPSPQSCRWQQLEISYWVINGLRYYNSSYDQGSNLTFLTAC